MGHKISIIGSAGLPASYGGFETLVEHIVINAPKNESDLSIFVYYRTFLALILFVIAYS